MSELRPFFVTLVQELSGYCIMAMATNEDVLRAHLAKHYGNLWCSVYEAPPPEKVIGETLYIYG